MGRDVHFEKSCGGLLDCSFAELCARPLWTNDYLKLTQVGGLLVPAPFESIHSTGI